MPHYKLNTAIYWFDTADEAAEYQPDAIAITDAEADAMRSATQRAQFDSLTYAQKRASEYPSITDYLDGIVKGDQVQVQTYIDACLAVKAKYPKG